VCFRCATATSRPANQFNSSLIQANWLSAWGVSIETEIVMGCVQNGVKAWWEIVLKIGVLTSDDDLRYLK
jgi:hypothetical protein